MVLFARRARNHVRVFAGHSPFLHAGRSTLVPSEGRTSLSRNPRGIPAARRRATSEQLAAARRERRDPHGGAAAWGARAPQVLTQLVVSVDPGCVRPAGQVTTGRRRDAPGLSLRRGSHLPRDLPREIAVRAGDASRPTTGARATGVPSRRSPLPPPPYGSSARGSVKTYTAAAAAARGLSLDRREEMVERDAGARAEGAPVKHGGGGGGELRGRCGIDTPRGGKSHGAAAGSCGFLGRRGRETRAKSKSRCAGGTLGTRDLQGSARDCASHVLPFDRCGRKIAEGTPIACSYRGTRHARSVFLVDASWLPSLSNS